MLGIGRGLGACSLCLARKECPADRRRRRESADSRWYRAPRVYHAEATSRSSAPVLRPLSPLAPLPPLHLRQQIVKLAFIKALIVQSVGTSKVRT